MGNAIRAVISSTSSSGKLTGAISAGKSLYKLRAEIQGGIQGPQGETGATFTPHMADDGTLSWTNDRELTNPQSKNLTGPQGQQGIQGPVGPQGPAGRDAEAETMLQMDIDSLFKE